MAKNKALVVFQGKKIRRIWHNNEWYFSVVDIVGVLTESSRARKYWSDLKKKLVEEGFELSEKIGQLKIMSSDGKAYLTDCLKILQKISRTAGINILPCMLQLLKEAGKIPVPRFLLKLYSRIAQILYQQL